MRIRHTFFLTFSFFLFVWAAFGLTKDSPKIQQIDQQIEELQDMKKGYESRARRHEDQAQRLQFEDRAVLETRRHLDLAEENRAKAEAVQKEIDRLEAERAKLLKAENG